MGTHTFYLTSRNRADECMINWQAMDTDILFRSSVLKDSYNKCLTLEEVAKKFDERKLFGYLDEELIGALLEFNQNLIPYMCQPRVYFSWEGGDWCYGLEFFPGTSKVNIMRYDYGHLLIHDCYSYRDIIGRVPDLPGWSVEQLY